MIDLLIFISLFLINYMGFISILFFKKYNLRLLITLGINSVIFLILSLYMLGGTYGFTG